MSDLGLTERRATPRGEREEVQDGNEIGPGSSSIHSWCFTHLGIRRQGGVWGGQDSAAMARTGYLKIASSVRTSLKGPRIAVSTLVYPLCRSYLASLSGGSGLC